MRPDRIKLARDIPRLVEATNPGLRNGPGLRKSMAGIAKKDDP
jgi:hypothetical protein